MTVEGIGISSISRIKCLAWNTIASWQYLACQVAGEFNDLKLKGFELVELQADEICTFAGTKKKSIWILVENIGISFLVLLQILHHSPLFLNADNFQ